MTSSFLRADDGRVFDYLGRHVGYVDLESDDREYPDMSISRYRPRSLSGSSMGSFPTLERAVDELFRRGDVVPYAARLPLTADAVATLLAAHNLTLAVSSEVPRNLDRRPADVLAELLLDAGLALVPEECTREAIRREVRDWLSHRLGPSAESVAVGLDYLSDAHVDELLAVARGTESCPYAWRADFS